MANVDTLTWEQVFTRDDIIGGDLETVEDGIPYRGPISEVEVRGEMVIISGPWVARMEKGGWKLWKSNPLSLNKEFSPPQDIGQGRVFFHMIMLGHGTIFPKGGSKLDPAKVAGLVIDEKTGE